MNKNILKELTILYIEDDNSTREYLTNILKMLCNNIIAIDSCDDGIELYHKYSPDIIISDIMLGKINGLDFVKLIRDVDKNIPIILISAYSDKEFLLDAVKLRLTDYIIKPIDFDKLQESLKKATEYIIDNGLYNIHINDDLVYNISSKCLFKDNKEVKLTNYELILLELLIKHKDRVVTIEEIKTTVWCDEYPSDGALKSLIHKLRKKIGKDTINSTSGIGFKIKLKNKG